MIIRTGIRLRFPGVAACLLMLFPLFAGEAETAPSKIYSLQELQEDFKQLRTAMEDLHPAMYDFLPRADFERLFEKKYAELRDGMSLEAAFRTYASLLASVGCLHTNAWMPEGYWSKLTGKLFPIKMKFVENSVFAVGTYHETDSLPPGSEILAINGKSMAEIQKRLKTVISADFYSDYYRNFRLGFRFPLLYSLFYGHPDLFLVAYRAPGAEGLKEAKIKPVPTLRIWRNMRDPRRLDLDIESEIETAVITISDFSYYREHDEFFGFIDSAFAEIAAKKIKNLILDLRLNNGGDPFCAAHLFSYIARESVPYFSRRYGKYAGLADPVPLAKNRFRGNLYILVDGGCASTTGHLCGLLKYHRLGTLIGEETGATYTCNDAHRNFLLNHTRFQIGIATGTFATAVQGLSKSQGILPDLPVQQTAEDLAVGRDTALEYALHVCRENKSRNRAISDRFYPSDSPDQANLSGTIITSKRAESPDQAAGSRQDRVPGQNDTFGPDIAQERNDIPGRDEAFERNNSLRKDDTRRQNAAPRQNEHIKQLIQRLASEEWEAAMNDLAEAGEGAVTFLLQALHDYSGHRYLPYRAALTLGKIQSKRGFEGLLKAFKDPSVQDYVKRGIIQSLGEIGSDEAVQTLILIVKDTSHNDFIRRTAVLTLAQFPTLEIVELIHQVFQEERSNLGYPCVLAWARMQSDAALDKLIAALEQHPDYLSIEEILAVLNNKRPDVVLPLLFKSLQEDNWPSVYLAAKELASIGKPAEKKLIDMLLDEDAGLRQRAAWILGEIPSPSAADPLFMLLEDKSWMVRNEALVALAKIQRESSLQSLVEKVDARIPDSNWAVDFLSIAPSKFENPGFAQEISPPAVTPYDHDQSISLPLYPLVLEQRPDLPSPVRDRRMREYVTAVTKTGEYLLVPVTVENGQPYDLFREGKGKQLTVDAADFPTLAASGLHSDEELEKTQTITGRSLAEITALGRPERSSGAGFMAGDEDIISVLREDNRLARALGLTHRELATPMYHTWNLVLEQTIASRDNSRPWADAAYFLYNEKKILFDELSTTKGWQESIFKDEVIGGYHIRIRRDLDAEEKALINAKYSHLGEGQVQELIQRLTRIHTSEIEPYYIMRYGFYEGHTDYRADPIAIAFIFGLKSLAEIEAAFPGKLYVALTSHFTR